MSFRLPFYFELVLNKPFSASGYNFKGQHFYLPFGLPSCQAEDDSKPFGLPSCQAEDDRKPFGLSSCQAENGIKPFGLPSYHAGVFIHTRIWSACQFLIAFLMSSLLICSFIARSSNTKNSWSSANRKAAICENESDSSTCLEL